MDQPFKELTTEAYQDYFFVGGRNGLLTMEDLHFQISFLNLVNEQLLDLASFKSNLELSEQIGPRLDEEDTGNSAGSI